MHVDEIVKGQKVVVKQEGEAPREGVVVEVGNPGAAGRVGVQFVDKDGDVTFVGATPDELEVVVETPKAEG